MAQSPFQSAVNDSYLRALVTDFFIEGGDPAATYILNYETAQFTSANLFRIRFVLSDARTGEQVAFWGRQSDRDFTNGLPGSVFFTRGPSAPYTGITALAKINWSAIDWGKTVLTQYMSAEEAGIRADRVVTREAIMTRFAAAAEPQITLTVGSGMTSPTHFNSFSDAIRSLYIDGIEITRSTFPCTDIAAFSNQVLIECVEDGYSEQMPVLTGGGLKHGILIPPFVTLRGLGDTRLFLPDDGGTAPVLEAPFSFRIENIQLENQSAGYALHIDNANGLSRRDERNGGPINFPLVSVMQGVRFIGSQQQATWLIGSGISSGQLMVFEDCDVIGAKQSNLLGIHNSPNDTDKGRVEITNTRFNDADLPFSAALQLIKSFELAEPHEVILTNSRYGLISNGTTIGGSLGFVVTER